MDVVHHTCGDSTCTDPTHLVVMPASTRAPVEQRSSGRFGEILEHPELRGLRYMVICSGPRLSEPDLWALVVSECPRYAANEVGKVVLIGASGWLIIEPGIEP